jgi:hypothetical protein
VDSSIFILTRIIYSGYLRRRCQVSRRSYTEYVCIDVTEQDGDNDVPERGISPDDYGFIDAQDEG